MANFATWSGDTYLVGLNATQLAKVCGLPHRRLRELVRLGAITGTSTQGVRAGYSHVQVEQGRRAARLLALGLTSRQVAAIAAELNARGRPGKALSLEGFVPARSRTLCWTAGGVEITAPANRSAAQQRLLEAIGLAIKSFRKREKSVRAAIALR